MELESQLGGIRKRGLGLAAISYDSVEILKDFATRRQIGYPLLSDPGSKIIESFGILNAADYPPGRLEHGVPYPGTFLTDAQGVVVSKDFQPRYAERRTAASFLTLAGDSPASALTELRTDNFTLRLSASNRRAAPGNRVTLVLDFEMGPKRHAYAPGVEGYRPLRVRLDPRPLLSVHETAFPESTPYLFAPLNETVPVFLGRFRVTQDVTLADGRAFAELLKTPDPKLEVTGTLDYQVCSDSVCYPPSALLLRFTLDLIPLDRERAPEPLRRQPKPQ